jgi:flagellar hook assembly protein FlgD
MNFPNPFNLKSKAVTLQDPGSNNASQTVNGTMIKISVPGDLSGNAEIEIYNVAGEKVRTLSTNIPTGGTHYYIEWNGANDRGNLVASGTYIARFTIGGGHQKFFKMSVVK